MRSQRLMNLALDVLTVKREADVKEQWQQDATSRLLNLVR